MSEPSPEYAIAEPYDGLAIIINEGPYQSIKNLMNGRCYQTILEHQPEIIDNIRQALAAGRSPRFIAWSARQAGNDPTQVDMMVCAAYYILQEARS